MKFGMAGHFRIEKREIGTNKLTAVREFNNLITNRGLDGYGRRVSRLLGWCALGKGTNTPLPTDTYLGQYSVTSNMVTSFTASAPTAPDYVASGVWRYRFNAGTAVGTFSEIGIGNGGFNDGNGFLWSRALILDDRGQPSSITILENEYLDVYYTLYLHLPTNATESFIFDIFGVTYSVTGKLAQATSASIGSYEGTLGVQGGTLNQVKTNSTSLGDITETVNGVETDGSSSGYPYHPQGSLQPYTDGTYTITSSFYFGLGNDNYENGISGLTFTTWVHNGNSLNIAFQYLITPAIPKTIERELTLTFGWSWGRYGE